MAETGFFEEGESVASSLMRFIELIEETERVWEMVLAFLAEGGAF
jgi:hypothetical protein